MNMWRPIYTAFILAAASTGLTASLQGAQGASQRPNVIVIMTDDQGYGDVGFHGNEVVHTPNLDSFAKESVELTQFYVTPVCSTTRAGLLTGRYHYRTGVTNVGGCGDRLSINEVTLADLLQEAGYATAIFGKWHLGDYYPMRPQDNGFAEVVIHKGCCLTPWFRPKGKNYFDPILFHNGKKEQYSGYCMDVYTDLVMDFAEANRDQPFFIYLASNTPHTPLVVGDEYSQPYREMGIDNRQAAYYGTVTNIDHNFGRLISKLKKLGLFNSTLIIFLSDNGPVTSKKDWPIQLRGRKSTVYEGGIRVPCLVSWPDELTGDRRIDRVASYVDLTPTILDAARIDPPDDVAFDGASLVPLLRDSSTTWPDRMLFIQWHQGRQPESHRAFAVRNQRYKLVQAQGHEAGPFNPDQRRYELFDIAADPCEREDLSSNHPEIVAEMKQLYEAWFAEVMASQGAAPQPIHIGSTAESPSRLMASGSIVNQDVTPSLVTGQWPARVLHSGKYGISLAFHKKQPRTGTVHFKFGEITLEQPVSSDSNQYHFEDVQLPQQAGMIEAYAITEGRIVAPTYVDVELTSSLQMK